LYLRPFPYPTLFRSHRKRSSSSFCPTIGKRPAVPRQRRRRLRQHPRRLPPPPSRLRDLGPSTLSPRPCPPLAALSPGSHAVGRTDRKSTRLNSSHQI